MEKLEHPKKKDILETFYDYKDFKIRLRSGHCIGFGFNIFKEAKNANSPNGLKRVYLREKRYNFSSSKQLLNEAKAYIDNHSEHLYDKFNKRKPKLESNENN